MYKDQRIVISHKFECKPVEQTSEANIYSVGDIPNIQLLDR